MKLQPTIVAALLLFAAGPCALAQKTGKAQITFKGTGSLSSGADSSGSEIGYQTATGPGVDAQFNRQISGTMSPARVSADHAPNPPGAAITGPGANFSGFMGLTHRDQRLASNGNNFSLEPPDQGLAVGNGFVLEAVNTAIAVYTPTGLRVAGPTTLNAFFGLAPSILRTSPPVYGPFTTDPKAYYDASTNRWFLTVVEIDADPATGDLLGRSSVMIAVSQSGDPTKKWNLFAIDTTDTGGNGCPCFGDQPLIGADQYGFYITTNEFSIAGPQFNGAQIYAMSKAALAKGVLPTVVAFNGPALAEGISYSVQPVTTPPGGAYESANGGTEYFASALDFFNTLDNRIAVWALTNTSSLATSTPKLKLTNTIVGTVVYGLPPAMQQKAGPTPLLDLLGTRNNILGVTTTEHLELIDGDDDRMQQAVFAAGSIYTALGTLVKNRTGPARAGIAWFIVTPHWSGGTLTATMANQGYLAADNEYIAYPSIGVNTAGKGIMTFTLVGPDYYPSAAYATIDPVNGVGPIQIAAPGAAPEDGFTGYGAYGGRVARWGDYSAAVADSDGSIWTAVEYIPNAPRTVLANWGTFVSRIVP